MRFEGHIVYVSISISWDGIRVFLMAQRKTGTREKTETGRDHACWHGRDLLVSKTGLELSYQGLHGQVH